MWATSRCPACSRQHHRKCRSDHDRPGRGDEDGNIPLATTETISILTDEGGDTVDVTTFDSDVSPHLVVDGEFPSAKRFSDNLIVRNGSASHVQFRNVQSHNPGDGTVFAIYELTSNETVIDYFGIEDIRFFH